MRFDYVHQLSGFLIQVEKHDKTDTGSHHYPKQCSGGKEDEFLADRKVGKR